MSQPSLYFDYNSSALITELLAVFQSAAPITGANPSSVHAMGREVRAFLEQGRQEILNFFTSNLEKEYSVVFTSGATEANNLVLLGYRYFAVEGAFFSISVLSWAYISCVSALAEADVPVQSMGNLVMRGLSAIICLITLAILTI